MPEANLALTKSIKIMKNLIMAMCCTVIIVFCCAYGGPYHDFKLLKRPQDLFDQYHLDEDTVAPKAPSMTFIFAPPSDLRFMVLSHEAEFGYWGRREVLMTSQGFEGEKGSKKDRVVSVPAGGILLSNVLLQYRTNWFKDALHPSVTIIQETQLTILSHKNTNIVSSLMIKPGDVIIVDSMLTR
jgi:hypothetical protein